MHVYLIYDYEEHGPENIQATTNRLLLVECLDAWHDTQEYRPTGYRAMRQTVMEFIDNDSMDTIHLGSGWGGPVLEVVALK